MALLLQGHRAANPSAARQHMEHQYVHFLPQAMQAAALGLADSKLLTGPLQVRHSSLGPHVVPG